MKKTPLLLTNSGEAIPIASLEKWAYGWLIDCEIAQRSSSTIANCRLLIEKLLWFLRDRGYKTCGVSEIKDFLAYISNGHEDKRGRWGNNCLRTKVRPSTVATHYTNLRTMFRYFVAEGLIKESPVERIKPPISRRDQIMPFSEDQVWAILNAARRSEYRRRDEAIVLFLLDTGVRNTELCNLRLSQLDLHSRRCTILGKGNKRRLVYFGKRTAKALWQYLQEYPCEENECVFRSIRGTSAGEGLTKDGLCQLIRRLGKAANLSSVRCSPHTFRHTFAIQFLRSGGNVFTLKELLGHTSLTIVNRYVALAEADIEHQHRQYSPVDRLINRRE